MSYFKTNDGVSLYYDIRGGGKPLLMVQGWTFTAKLWEKNAEKIAERCQVIRMDNRGHGESEKVMYSHCIARYAMDVKNLLDELELEDVTVLGSSMGAAVLWSYLQLFGNHRVSGLICVDQSPCQYNAPDWKWGQNNCYDVESFIRTCDRILYDPRGAAEQMAQGVLYREAAPEEIKMIADEICKCPGPVRIQIMRDHTNLDWRDFIPHITLPTLVMVARKSAVFPWQGCAWAGEHIPGAKLVFFEKSGHMIYWEEAEKFNETVAEFVCGGKDK